jgi:hypothetical protein
MLKRVSSLNRVEEDEQREFGPRPRGVLHSPSQAKPQVLLYSRHAHLNCIGCLPCNARKASKSPASAFVIWPATERTIPMATKPSSGSAGAALRRRIVSVASAGVVAGAVCCVFLTRCRGRRRRGRSRRSVRVPREPCRGLAPVAQLCVTVDDVGGVDVSTRPRRASVVLEGGVFPRRHHAGHRRPLERVHRVRRRPRMGTAPWRGRQPLRPRPAPPLRTAAGGSSS